MEKREIGKSGIFVNPVGLGTMGFSHAYGDPTDEQTAIETIRAAYDNGVDFFDTAESYTGVYPDGSISYNEELVGKALKDVRDKVVIATKMGVHHNEDRTLALDSSPEIIRKSLEKSLERLGTDYVDLYYQHRIDPKVEPEVVAQTMKELYEEGKIKAWGISEATEDYLRRANAVFPVSAIQNRYSMMARDHESIFPVCEELGVSYVAFSPMANGFLTGAWKPGMALEGAADYRENMPQYTEEGYKKAEKLLNYLSELAEKKNATPAQISLAWMINKEPFIIPIPGSRKLERIVSNFESGNIELSKQEVAELDALLDGMEFDVFGGNAKK